MSTPSRSKKTRNDRLRLIASGAQKHFPNASLTLAGQTLTTSALEQLLQQDIAATDAADKAHAAWLTAVQAQNASHRALAPVLRALNSYVLAQFGDSVDVGTVLADFGYSPRKVTKVPVDTKAAAAAKAVATRKARHTMGAKQKKAVHGGAPAPSPAPAPAPAPKSGS
jgi:hypothetical protein